MNPWLFLGEQRFSVLSALLRVARALRSYRDQIVEPGGTPEYQLPLTAETVDGSEHLVPRVHRQSADEVLQGAQTFSLEFSEKGRFDLTR